MYAIMGITGRVGGVAARALLQMGKKVRGIVRDKAKAASWERQGVELAVADSNDPAKLEAAFRDTEGVFVMIPPNFTPAASYPEAVEIAKSLRRALDAAKPPRVVVLSSVGAHHPRGLGLITQCHILEEALAGLATPHAFVRAGWFMDNSLWDVEPAREKGEIAAFLTPLDAKYPMVSTEDIGAVIARTLGETWTNKRVLELEGPARYSSNDSADTFARVLGRKVVARAVPRESWQTLFVEQGMPADRTAPRIEMIDGFNSGWIDFEGGAGTEHLRGATTLEEAYRALIS